MKLKPTVCKRSVAQVCHTDVPLAFPGHKLLRPAKNHRNTVPNRKSEFWHSRYCSILYHDPLVPAKAAVPPPHPSGIWGGKSSLSTPSIQIITPWTLTASPLATAGPYLLPLWLKRRSRTLPGQRAPPSGTCNSARTYTPTPRERERENVGAEEREREPHEKLLSSWSRKTLESKI